VVGTNGYCETWMDEAMATYFTHRLMDLKHGKNSTLLKFPAGLEWLPNIHRESYRSAGFYGVLGRGDHGPCVQEMPKFTHLVNLLCLCYDKGSRVVGMIEDRLGEAAFFDFIHLIYQRYRYRILRVADFRRELELYTGRSWEEFFQNWLYGCGLSDWAVEKVKLKPVKDGGGLKRLGLCPRCAGHCKATVVLHQKGEYTEPTVLGFCLDGGDGYQVRVPIQPHARVMDLEDPPAHIEALPDGRVLVEVVLPCRPTQITVDPDQVLIDREPANNCWKPRIRWRFSPVYTMLDETDLTCAYDRWNVTYGPWFFGTAYTDPWFTRSTMFGVRAGAYRTQQFNGGVYAAYRTDYSDIVAGADALWDHCPWPHTQFGLIAERRLATANGGDTNANRGVLFGRYVFQYGSSFYLPPVEYVEAFGAVQDNFLPFTRTPMPGGERFQHQTIGGLHYHINYLTPYWDAEGGYQFDVTYSSGLTVLGQQDPFNRLDAQFALVKCMPDWTGPLSSTRMAARVYGAAGLPDEGEFFPLGGEKLVRGFGLAERQGSVVWVASLEWRVPLARHLECDFCDHTAGLRNVYAAAFYDIGNAYLLGEALGPIAHSVGVGLRLDVAWLSFIERTILRFDMAKTVNASTPVQFWFGVQNPF
jgi:hypothetical protein